MKMLIMLLITVLLGTLSAQAQMTVQMKTPLNGMDGRGNVVSVDRVQKITVDGTAYECDSLCAGSPMVQFQNQKMIIEIPMVSEIWQFDLQLDSNMQMPTGMIPICLKGQVSNMGGECVAYSPYSESKR